MGVAATECIGREPLRCQRVSFGLNRRERQRFVLIFETVDEILRRELAGRVTRGRAGG